MISATYDDFLSVVAKGRGLDKDAVRAVAKGRVWAGSQAIEVCSSSRSRWAAKWSYMFHMSVQQTTVHQA